MTKEEIALLVKSKIRARPDTKYIDDSYLDDTIIDAINDTYVFINAGDDTDLVEELITPIKDLCVVRLNLTGTEGITSSSKGGTSESYIDDIPKAIKRKLRKYRNLP